MVRNILHIMKIVAKFSSLSAIARKVEWCLGILPAFMQQTFDESLERRLIQGNDEPQPGRKSFIFFNKTEPQN